MRKLSLLALAAAAAVAPTAVGAQPAPQPGHSWGGGSVRGGAAVHVPQAGHRWSRGHTRVRFPHVRRIHRGYRVPHFWFGPQFHVRNWQVYEFPQPLPDRRWVRYYDDALLIDRSGMVHDGRYGLDWDRYGERWGYDQSGIPIYVGDGDYHPDGRDYAWAEGEAEDWDYSQYRGEAVAHHGGPYPAPACHQPNPCGGNTQYGYAYPGYGYAYPAYGCGGGCGGTVTITETIIEPVTGYREEVIEEVVETYRPRRRPVRRTPPRRPAPPPPLGERG